MYQAQILSHESSWMTIIPVFWGLATFFQIKPESTAIMYVICTANANGQFVTMQYVGIQINLQTFSLNPNWHEG